MKMLILGDWLYWLILLAAFKYFGSKLDYYDGFKIGSIFGS